ncbi:MAG TPA: hypothetical protein VF476_04105, partial [Chitinophagaceae bacterium]
MKKPQWITVATAVLLVAAIYSFGKIVPDKKIIPAEQHSDDDGHDHGPVAAITIDTILIAVKKQLSPEQVIRLNTLENSISRGDVKAQQLKVYHELSHFWG